MLNELARGHYYYDHEEITHCLATEIYGLYKENPKILFVCVGSDLSTYDVAGPLIGTDIKGLNLGFPVLGELGELVDANSIELALAEIKENYSDYAVIAIDSTVTHNENELGTISFEFGACYPASGINKSLPPIGDYVIKVINTTADVAFFKNSHTRFSLTYNMCNTVTQGIIFASEMINQHKSLLNK